MSRLRCNLISIRVCVGLFGYYCETNFEIILWSNYSCLVLKFCPASVQFRVKTKSLIVVENIVAKLITTLFHVEPERTRWRLGGTRAGTPGSRRWMISWTSSIVVGAGSSDRISRMRGLKAPVFQTDPEGAVPGAVARPLPVELTPKLSGYPSVEAAGVLELQYELLAVLNEEPPLYPMVLLEGPKL
jgi:hypothetical protein